MSYCFNELPERQKAAVEKQIIMDDMTFDVVSGINSAKRKLGSKEAVEQHFRETTVRVGEKLFSKGNF